MLKKIRIIAIIIFLLYTAFLSIVSIASFPKDLQNGSIFPYLADKPVGEDGYYMLTVAWNIASGKGIVYNFDLPTTGIQPLSTVIFALLAWIVQIIDGDKWLFVRFVLLFGGICQLLFGNIIGKITQLLSRDETKDLSYTFGFILIVFNFALYRWFTYGLETGIYLNLFGCCFLFTTELSRKPKKNMQDYFKLGFLFGLTAWARIDFGVIVIIFLLIMLLSKKYNRINIAITGCTSALVISPWLIYNYIITKSIIPSSGGAQAALINLQNAPDRIEKMGRAILGFFAPWVFSVSGGVFTLAAIISLFFFVLYLFRNKAINQRLITKIRENFVFISWTISISVLVIIYILFFWATHFYQRYSSPIVIPISILMAIFIAERINFLSNKKIILSSFFLPACFFFWAFLSLHTGRIGNSHVVSAGYIHDNFPYAKVGAFQSGVIGYFNSNVVNLDGKINQNALTFLKNGEIEQYLDNEKIDVIVDWSDVIDQTLNHQWLNSNWKLCQQEIMNNVSVCFQKKQ